MRSKGFSKEAVGSTPKVMPNAATRSGTAIPSHLSCLSKCAESLGTSDGYRIDIWKGTAIPSHLSCLSKCAESLGTSDGYRIDIWELSVPEDASYLSVWASNFRQHYCSDSEIDALRAGTGLS